MHTQIDAQEQEDDSGIAASVRFSVLPPFLRVILVTDGTVTRSLEAYFNEPIDVVVISHDEVPSDRHYPQIHVAPGDQILRRAVTLVGHHSRTPYAFAESIITDRLAAHLRRKLFEGKKGIGELMREDRLETYRELLDIRRRDAGARAPHLAISSAASVLTRTYRIYHDRRATIQIEEAFPEARYHGAAPWQAAT
jgi:chorismate-pyruvate lyase